MNSGGTHAELVGAGCRGAVARLEGAAAGVCARCKAESGAPALEAARVPEIGRPDGAAAWHAAHRRSVKRLRSSELCTKQTRK